MAEPRKNAPKTRGKPFAPGNAGRPKGARNKTTVSLEKILAADADEIARTVIKAAKAGDLVAAKIVLDRVAPMRKERPVSFALPAIVTAADAATAMSKVIAAVASGALSPGEGESVSSLIGDFTRTLEVADFERRLAALERRTP